MINFFFQLHIDLSRQALWPMVEAYFDVDLEVNGGGSRVGSGLVDDRHFYFWKSVFGCASASLFIARIVAKQLNVVAIYYSPMVHLR